MFQVEYAQQPTRYVALTTPIVYQLKFEKTCSVHVQILGHLLGDVYLDACRSLFQLFYHKVRNLVYAIYCQSSLKQD